jgi:hypothetical protein
MSNPVMEAIISAKVSDMIAPPRSWGHAEKAAFLKLPRELQLFYARREAQRDREVRRSQNEAAEARKALAETQRLLAEVREALAAIQKSKETTNGTTEKRPEIA